jgi:uncharacterized protein DUF4446
VVVVLLLLLAILEARRIRRLQERLEGLTRGVSGRSIEAILEAHLEKVFQVARELDELSARSAILEGNYRRAIQRVGLVRFNPFEGTGGNQSFSFALLDARGNGFVVSSLHSGSGTRLDAKPLTAGQSDAALSTEEAQAVDMALASPGGNAARPESTPTERAQPAP